ncbi:hypothetical protein [Rhizobium sp. PL01]|uniref:hypothetical protein n=1 Tax=Rhizobium sp. PL01 TaxID=3085631 RepID=UPI002980F854|nr:hypothetical protein [Rhizobium sp. PL01]MDW5318486.1 hypothetical protein [Rhizobium sp. PL01]
MNYFVGFVMQVKDKPNPIVNFGGSAPGFSAGQLVRVEQLGQGWFQVQQVYIEVLPGQINTTVLLGTLAPAGALSADEAVPIADPEVWKTTI